MNRKTLTLALMDAGDEPVSGRTRLQKMVFMTQQEFDGDVSSLLGSDSYDFVPYDYGPFSQGLYADLDDLVDAGLIREIEKQYDKGVLYKYQLTGAGREHLEEQVNQQTDVRELLQVARAYKQRYNSMSLDDVIDEVYSAYPEYASESVY
jgi:uncharacterized protein YwgA